jgi:hypothetical protein
MVALLAVGDGIKIMVGPEEVLFMVAQEVGEEVLPATPLRITVAMAGQ